MTAPQAKRRLTQEELDVPLETRQDVRGFHCGDCRSSWQVPSEMTVTQRKEGEEYALYCHICRDQYGFEQNGEYTLLDAMVSINSVGYLMPPEGDSTEQLCPEVL